MGTNNPGLIRVMGEVKRAIASDQVIEIINTAVTAAVSSALSAKADLDSNNKVPDSQLPDRLSDAQIAVTAGNAAASAVTAAMTARNLGLPGHGSSVSLGADTTAEAQISGGAKHWELLPSATPLAPATGARLWVETIGGKNTLRILFPTGPAITLATET